MRILQDPYGRIFSYLRLSLTDACNFRCRYCLPHGYRQRPHLGEVHEDTLLTVDEIENLVSAFSELGFTKVRLSGGEPTLRPDIVEIVRRIASIAGIETVALTTNGYRLEKLAPELMAAGLSAVNVSVDSLDPTRFTEITGMDLSSRVLAGVKAALDAGISRIKLNVVALRSYIDSDLPEFVEFVRRRPVAVRFIELMETADNRAFFEREHISGDEIAQRLVKADWVPTVRESTAGPGSELLHRDYQGRLGVIAAYSKNFCDSCNRLRISSRGKLRLCLFGEGEYSLRAYLQEGNQRDELIHEIRNALENKTRGHRLHERLLGRADNLASIGG